MNKQTYDAENWVVFWQKNTFQVDRLKSSEDPYEMACQKNFLRK